MLLVGAVLAVTLGARHLAPLPDLVLVVVASAGLRSGWQAGLVTGLVGGWVLDLLPPGSTVLGTQALLYAVCGLLVGLARRPGRVSVVWVVAVVGAAAVGCEVVRSLVALASGVPVDPWGSVGRVVATATIALVVVPLVTSVERRAEQRRFA
ncbi:rod shape-determining protein MreD [Knoellia subterranea KCTC 19937]|uniref:Rod shape-determining protein MreD n=1 Tax=Knoellia subterranea KCTC 19937 TaxID=1385521 RepID=A0A0A0JSU3_9MICO|nr:rod shape-determining protein MreD [Knoellia subterranea KCTC 19937]